LFDQIEAFLQVRVERENEKRDQRESERAVITGNGMWRTTHCMAAYLIVLEIDVGPINLLSGVLLLLQFEHKLVEELLQLLVGVVDAKLLQRVELRGTRGWNRHCESREKGGREELARCRDRGRREAT
jgi:hypothetical protein